MKKGAAVGFGLFSTIGTLIKLTIPSEDDIIITGLLNIQKVVDNPNLLPDWLFYTIVIAIFVGVIGAMIGAVIELIFKNRNFGF